MKKEEAEKLLCPFMSSIQNNFGTLSNGWSYEVRTDKNVTCNTNCITTKCMAWRFEKTTQSHKDTSDEYKFAYPDNAVDELGYNDKQVLRWTVYTDEGYCMRLER